jgi:hypothetical protein
MKLLVALGRFLIRNPARHVEANQLLQPIRREMAGNSMRRLKRFRSFSSVFHFIHFSSHFRQAANPRQAARQFSILIWN